MQARLVRDRLPDVLLIAGILALDQLTKVWVRATVPLHGSLTIIPNLVDLTHLRNTGAAFGILNNRQFAFKSLVIAAFGFLALLTITVYAFRVPKADRLTRTALALILGGALGNLVDRLVTGYVVDFVDVYWRAYHFWAFNVADAAISVGVVLMVLTMFRGREEKGTSSLTPETTGESLISNGSG